MSEDRGALIFILQKEMKTRNIWSVIIVFACCNLTLTEVVIEAWDGTGRVTDLFVLISMLVCLLLGSWAASENVFNSCHI